MGKNQHYVPQFYLRLFSNNSKSIGTWNSKTDKVITNASISNMASRDNLYGSDQALENQLASWEKDWSICIRKIIEKNKIEDINDFLSLLTFITIGHSRTLKSAEENNYINDYLSKLLLSSKIPEKTLNSIKIEMDIPNLISMKASAEMTNLLFDLNYAIIENTSPVEFITSDNPICCYNKFYVHRNYKRNYGWGTAGLIIILPLCPKKCLCLYDPVVYKTIPNNFIMLNSINEITNINRLLTRNAYHNIFFNNQQSIYINKIKLAHRTADIKSTVQVFGPLLKIGSSSILDKFDLNFIKIRKKYKRIELPSHMGGLLRKPAEQYQKELHDKYYKI